MYKKILIIEPNQELRGLYEGKLRENGYDVISAESGQEALHDFLQNDLDAIVLEPDVHHGVQLDFLEEFRKRNPGAKMVINSGHPELKLNFATWIADAFIVKSQDSSDLMKTVNELLN